MNLFTKISENIVKGDAETVHKLAEQAVAENIPANKILEEGLVAGMMIVSEKFKNNEFFIPEVLVSAKAMKSGMRIIKPLLARSDVGSQGKVVIGTIQGDLHDIGKNIVAMLLEGAGFTVIDLGADASIEKFVAAAKEENADIIGMSALLTTTMINMKSVIERLFEEGLNTKVKTMIGGAPVTQSFADDIRADGYAPDASTAVDLAKSLLNK